MLSEDVILQDIDVAKAIIDFVTKSAIEKLVVGHPARNGLIRSSNCFLDIPTPFRISISYRQTALRGRKFKTTDLVASITKGAPDFCSVYVINKGKVSSERQAVRQAPAVSPFRQLMQTQNNRRQKPIEAPAPTSKVSRSSFLPLPRLTPISFPVSKYN